MDENKKSKPLAFIFLSVCPFFLFLLLLVLVSFYVVGNYRGFLDESLIVILFFISSVSLFVDVYLFVMEKRLLFFLFLILFLFFILVSVVFAIINTLIVVIS